MIKNINFTALFLALLVVLMFCMVGVAVAYSNILFMILFFVLGSLIMGFGIYLKRKRGI